MRNFSDSWANIIDDRGKFLKGRVTFYEAGSTTKLKSIFDAEGNPLPNPIFTDAWGKTQNQVFLDDSDYTIVFERYIGEGIMESDSDEDVWFNYKTIVSKNGKFTIENEMAAIQSVETIAALRDLENMEDGDIIQVFGYFTKEDCPPRYFVWHSQGSVADDGGCIIHSNSTTVGYWKMIIPGTYIDVRWYGDIPYTSPAGTGSNLGQRVKAAQSANANKKDLYFPGLKNELACYLFDGSNTVSVTKDIICDNSVRFVVKEGTVGTKVQCNQLHKSDNYLFISQGPSAVIGGFELESDWSNSSWFSGRNPANARVGYIIDKENVPGQYVNTTIKINGELESDTSFTNCEIVESTTKISTPVNMYNMIVKTDWFAADYSWSNLHLNGCKILIENCKDADTYILLKTKQNEADYGDLHEQTLHGASVQGNCIIENCNGSITMQTHGNIELHNASLTISNLNASDNINAVDAWLQFGSTATTIGNISLRRGDLFGTGSLTLVSGTSLLDNVSVNIPINTTGIKLIVKNSEINSQITTRNIDLINNQINAQIDQSDYAGIITVKVSGNMFNDNGIHYVHANTPNTKVIGIWTNNGSTYSDKHWIKLDRTNLLVQDNDHQYSYINNSEPFMMKYSGRNRPMRFNLFRGNRFSGRGCFSTTNIPFVFMNTLTYIVTVVPRMNIWKAFTVGRGYLARDYTVSSSWKDGIFEDDYSEHTTGDIVTVFNAGANRITTNSAIMQGKVFGYAPLVSVDPDGIANYNVGFEAINQDHTDSVFSQGVELGVLNHPPYDGWSSTIPEYPDVSRFITLFIDMKPDFVAGETNPANFNNI